MLRPQTIRSGGQTGVDQIALSIAQELGFHTGGVAPKGWRTDDGPAPWLAEFGLVESWSRDWGPRTIQNVREAHATVWFGVTDSAGAKVTLEACRQELARYGKPFWVNPDPLQLLAGLDDAKLLPWKLVLNVAGNRLRTHPEATDLAERVLRVVLPDLVPF